MKNRFSRLISLAVMIVLLLTSCVIPMSAMAVSRLISQDNGTFRVILETEKKLDQKELNRRETLEIVTNNSNKIMTVKRTYSRPNQLDQLSLGANANRGDLYGLPGNASTKTFNVKLKPNTTVRFYAKRYSYRKEWQHVKIYQRRIGGGDWDTYRTETSQSFAKGIVWSFEQIP